jgi:hypothetical protein
VHDLGAGLGIGKVQRAGAEVDLIETCTLVGVDPHAYLGDVITRMVECHPQSRLDDLLP